MLLLNYRIDSYQLFNLNKQHLVNLENMGNLSFSQFCYIGPNINMIK